MALKALRKRQVTESIRAGTAYTAGLTDLDWYAEGDAYVVTDEFGIPVPAPEAVATGKSSDQWLFSAPLGGPLSESNWKRSVQWSNAIKEIGKSKLRVHDYADIGLTTTFGTPVRRSGRAMALIRRWSSACCHASAAMTMDLYGHLIDQNLWNAAKRIGGTTGAPDDEEDEDEEPAAEEDGS